MNLLDEHQKMVAEDELNQNNYGPIDGVKLSDEEVKEFEKRLNEMREQIKNNEDCGIDVEKACNKEFVDPYEKVDEKDLKTEYVKVTPMVKRAYCPKCGAEIINNIPSMYNPFSFEKINRFECDCGWQANLPYSYPRVVFVTENGVQIDAFAK